MKQFYKHNDKYYFVHRDISLSHFTNKNGIIDLELVKDCRDYFSFVDHVLRTDTHFLFVETIQDAEIIEENQELVEEAHSGHSA
jgi:predicted small integral membrane protein